MSESLLPVVIQGGAFGLIAWYFVYGLDKWNKMLERTQDKYVVQMDKLSDLHRKELEAARLERMETHKQCEEGHAQKTRALDQVAEVLQAVKQEMQRLVDKSDVPRPMKPPKSDVHRSQ